MPLGILIIVLSIVVCYVKMKDEEGFDVLNLFLSTLFGTGIGVLIVMVCLLCCLPFTKISDFKPNGTINIMSVQTKDSVSGNFSLGTGYIGNTRYYIAMQDLGNNRYKSVQIPENQVDYIEEDDSVKPCVNIFKKEKTNRIATLLTGIPFDVVTLYVIVVPKNTVMVKYQVN